MQCLVPAEVSGTDRGYASRWGRRIILSGLWAAAAVGVMEASTTQIGTTYLRVCYLHCAALVLRSVLPCTAQYWAGSLRA